MPVRWGFRCVLCDAALHLGISFGNILIQACSLTSCALGSILWQGTKKQRYIHQAVSAVSCGTSLSAKLQRQ